MSNFTTPFSDDSKSSSLEPIDWSEAKPLPPVTDTVPSQTTLCTEGADVYPKPRSYENFNYEKKNDN